MFRRSGYRFAAKNMRHSTNSRACSDSNGTEHALAPRSAAPMHPDGKPVPVLEFGLLLLLGILWGIPYALTKIALETIPPITLTAARVALAAVALWIIAILLGRQLPRRWDIARRLFIQGAVACVIPYTLIAFGQQSVDSALAAILNSS